MKSQQEFQQLKTNNTLQWIINHIKGYVYASLLGAAALRILFQTYHYPPRSWFWRGDFFASGAVLALGALTLLLMNLYDATINYAIVIKAVKPGTTQTTGGAGKFIAIALGTLTIILLVLPFYGTLFVHEGQSLFHDTAPPVHNTP